MKMFANEWLILVMDDSKGPSPGDPGSSGCVCLSRHITGWPYLRTNWPSLPSTHHVAETAWSRWSARTVPGPRLTCIPRRPLGTPWAAYQFSASCPLSQPSQASSIPQRAFPASTRSPTAVPRLGCPCWPWLFSQTKHHSALKGALWCFQKQLMRPQLPSRVNL